MTGLKFRTFLAVLFIFFARELKLSCSCYSPALFGAELCCHGSVFSTDPVEWDGITGVIASDTIVPWLMLVFKHHQMEMKLEVCVWPVKYVTEVLHM